MDKAKRRLLIDKEELKAHMKLFKIEPLTSAEITEEGEVRSTENLFKWKGVIYGQPDTPYEGGTFHISVSIPEMYPLKPPLVTFLTKIYHPNIHVNGQVCMDKLKQSNWNPCLGLSGTLLSIILLLADPNPNDPLNEAAGKLMVKNKDLFEGTARLWTVDFAMET